MLKENDGSVHCYIICTVEAPRMRGYWSEKDQIGYVLTEFGSSLFNVWVGEEMGGGQRFTRAVRAGLGFRALTSSAPRNALLCLGKLPEEQFFRSPQTRAA